jgi:hypothetical protein
VPSPEPEASIALTSSLVLALAAALLLAEAPGVEPDDPQPRWVPVQGSAAFAAMFAPDGASTLGASFYLGVAWGRPYVKAPLTASHEGPFAGLGALGFVGATDDKRDCAELPRCASRWYAGGAVRVGYAFFNRRPDQRVGHWLWPDAHLYAQLGAFYGAEQLGPGPLSPPTPVPMYGGRLDVGVTSPAMTRSVIWLGREILGNIIGQTLMSLLLFPFVLLNHFELQLELSHLSYSQSAVRVALCMGSGF